MLATLPFFHSFGYTVCLWAPLVVGMEAVFYPDPRAAKEVGELCRKHRCTHAARHRHVRAVLPPPVRSRTTSDSLRLLICGAEKLPVKLAEEFHAKFGVLPLEGYGCTELSPVVSTNLPDVEVGGLTQRGNTLRHGGPADPGRVREGVRPGDARAAAAGDRGRAGGEGAERDGSATCTSRRRRSEVVRDGWYVTGDVGLVEPDGFIRITGRVSRFAKIAGEMVPLERLDEEMHDVLGGGGDRVLAVAAVPDEKRGERVVVLHLPDGRGATGGRASRSCGSGACRTCGCRTRATATRWRRSRYSAAASST